MKELGKSIAGFLFNAIGIGFTFIGIFLVYTIALVVLIQFVAELSGWIDLGFAQLLLQWFAQIVGGIMLIAVGAVLVAVGDSIDKSMKRGWR